MARKKVIDAIQDSPNTVFLAAYEASLDLQASLMRVWAPVGQKPFDLMNGEVSALYLNRLLAAYPDKPIVLLWDRAPWHKGAAIRSVLSAHPRLEIVWFPPGCPEINPQEHVWKEVREAVSHNHTFANLPELAEAFERYLERTQFPYSLLDKHNYRNLYTTFK